MAVAEEPPQQRMLVTAGRGRGAAKRLRLGLPVGVLFPVVHFLLELLGLLLVDKGQASQTLLKLKGVEEDAILVVVPRIVDFLIPHDAAIARLLCISTTRPTAPSPAASGVLTDMSTIFNQ